MLPTYIIEDLRRRERAERRREDRPRLELELPECPMPTAAPEEAVEETVERGFIEISIWD